LAPPGLVRRGGRPVRGGDPRRAVGGAQSDRGVAVCRAGARRPGVEPSGRARGDPGRGPELTTAVAASPQQVESVLLVLPPQPGPSLRVAPDTMVAGLPLLRRIVLAGARAGFSRVMVAHPAGVERLLAGTTAALGVDGTPAPDA